MDITVVVLIVLLLVIIFQTGLIFYLIQMHSQERKDLSDKLYFNKPTDFITNKTVEEMPKEDTPVEKEEEMIPLENVSIDELARAAGAKVK